MTSGQDNKTTETRPWERQRDENGQLESNLWYARFTDYRLLGSDRSLTSACNVWRAETGRKEQGYPSWRWRIVAEKWKWKARAEAWDEDLRQKGEAEWEARRKEQRETEWKSGSQLLERVKQMLTYPLAEVMRVEKVDENGKPVSYQVFKPVRWSQRDIARFMEAASKLRRLAAEMETERKRLEIVSEDDLDSAIAGELARLAGAGEGAALRTSEEEADAGAAQS